METICQGIEVKSDRKVEITLPDTIKPGLVEMVVTVQPMSRTQIEAAPPSSNLFGFLPQRIDPLLQRQLRDEWNR
ncbi:hypothetical protein AB3R30_21155 [Leptolyngbyaceae cyanobacterium UHCC 1019]